MSIAIEVQISDLFMTELDIMTLLTENDKALVKALPKTHHLSCWFFPCLVVA